MHLREMFYETAVLNPILERVSTTFAGVAGASKEAGLCLKERNIQLRALVSGSEGALRVCGGLVDVVQWYDGA